MNNINKLALVALSLFLAVGVCSCGKDDDKKSTGGDKPKVELTIDRNGKLEKTFADADGLSEGDCKFKITVRVIEGEITEDLAKTLKLTGSCDKKDKSLAELDIKSIENGKDKSFEIHCYAGEDDLDKLLTKVAIGTVNGKDYAVDSGAKKNNRKSLSGDKKIKFSLAGNVEVTKEAELTIDFKPQR